MQCLTNHKVPEMKMLCLTYEHKVPQTKMLCLTNENRRFQKRNWKTNGVVSVLPYSLSPNFFFFAFLETRSKNKTFMSRWNFWPVGAPKFFSAFLKTKLKKNPTFLGGCRQTMWPLSKIPSKFFGPHPRGQCDLSKIPPKKFLGGGGFTQYTIIFCKALLVTMFQQNTYLVCLIYLSETFSPTTSKKIKQFIMYYLKDSCWYF